MNKTTTEKTFSVDGRPYTVTPCTAIPVGVDDERQGALYVKHTMASGETVEYVVFGWDFEWLKTSLDFKAMTEEPELWTSDWETLATVKLDA